MAPTATHKKSSLSSAPTEVRLLIWEATIVPRILHITIDEFVLPQERVQRRHISSEIHSHIRFQAPEPCPVALHICRESRAVALKHYRPSFHSSTSPASRALTQKQSAIYFNPKLDVVHIVDETGNKVRKLLTYGVDQETRRSIRVLAIEGCVTAREDALTNHETRIWDGLELFDDLEEIIWIFDDGRTKEGRDFVRDAIEHNMNAFGSSLARKFPEVKVTNSRIFEREWS